MHNCRNYNPDAKITGIEVVEMVKKGTETIIGARIDPALAAPSCSVLAASTSKS